MLVFVIPLKSPQASKSWELVTKLFERCIKSVCHQTSSNYRVIVVCHQKPKIEFDHPHLTYIEVDFPPAINEPDTFSRGHTDKGRKILKGLIHAQEFSPSYTMTVDADDCVSKYLAEFVNQNHQNNGWFINKGYKYQNESDVIYVKRRNFYKMCGSCNILRYDLNNLPENPEYNRGYGYYKFYIDHEKVRETLAKDGNHLQPLPFAGAVYIIATGENLYYGTSQLTFSIFNRKTLNPSIREEFNLYPLNL
ncbi:glycosyltransferase family 2 protein [Brasilonema octagenarum]|uniref:Glycosyltransferase family 2 protein n=1 Tax=Brasilonema octagenarum UFV-OR1 TaxID=417115 RepID=A0ABX1MDK7_9CYAN|nr:glycosyltransferase family 2 protein [Brasilonema octagenarum]NMF66709.1 glycosyltransferase family 2 protein [Brasilonema octagenarum UFV-OR1]